MRVPLSWLSDYIDLPEDVDTLAHDLTMSGTNIEAVERSAPDFEGVFVGKVTERVQHPNADRLSLCQVEVGGKHLSIVCGAPNVRAGLTVAVAVVGARLPGDFKIRKSKIRGEISRGMICSARELGLGEEHDGILELDDALESGRDFHEVLPAGETVFEAEITPNRPDCLALLGVAREVAAVYGTPVKMPAVWSASQKASLGDPPVPVQIDDPEDCRRYIGRVIRNVRVGDSPDWMKQRLRSMGLDPINNVVDITNYVLFETGQPLHAFDLQALSGRILVRRARRGETLRTLDGVDRKLDPDILVIADDSGPVALAGVMGGASSMVHEETRDLLLESAWFRPDVVRAGRRKLGLDTDASYRFERGADVEAALWAADRATQLFVEVAGGDVAEREADTYPRPYEAPQLRLRVSRVNELIGTRLGAEEVTGLLRRLELPATADSDRVQVQVPSFRRDLEQEIDLVEEVARIHGYDSIPDDRLPPAPLQPQINAADVAMRRLRGAVIARGFHEVRPSAFLDTSDLDRLRLDEDDPRRKTVSVRNPLVSSCNTMRSTLVPGVLRVLRHNLHHGQETVRVLQLDRVFRDEPGPLAGLPTEADRLVLAACGLVRPPNWDEPPRPYDLYDLKGDLEGLFEELGVDTVWTWGYTEPFLDEATSFLISTGYGGVGRGGRVRQEVREAFDVDVPVTLVDLDVSALQQSFRERAVFEELPRFPAVKRDLSLVVPRQVTYAEVEDVVRRASGALLESVSCFDVFEEKGDDKRRSLGLRLRFRSADRTLTDELVEPQIQKILRKLEASLQVVLRAS